MSVRVTCPKCDASFAVDDKMRGKKVYCKKCERPILVPAAVDKDGD